MLLAAFKALGDVFSRALRVIILKALALTFLLFVAVLVGAQVLISILIVVPWPWAETLVAIGGGMALVAAFFFLMAPVMAIFAGLFLDEVASRVEAAHYPNDPPGTPISGGRAIVMSMQFAFVVVAVNLAALPLVFTGFGAAALVAANAYLLSREYFEMVAMRHMPEEDAKLLRKQNIQRIFAAGLLPAAIALVPVINIAVPLFATSYFVHIFKQMTASSANTSRYR